MKTKKLAKKLNKLKYKQNSRLAESYPNAHIMMYDIFKDKDPKYAKKMKKKAMITAITFEVLYYYNNIMNDKWAERNNIKILKNIIKHFNSYLDNNKKLKKQHKIKNNA